MNAQYRVALSLNPCSISFRLRKRERVCVCIRAWSIAKSSFLAIEQKQRATRTKTLSVARTKTQKMCLVVLVCFWLDNEMEYLHINSSIKDRTAHIRHISLCVFHKFFCDWKCLCQNNVILYHAKQKPKPTSKKKENGQATRRLPKCVCSIRLCGVEFRHRCTHQLQ